jgi:hypothetical protein
MMVIKECFDAKVIKSILCHPEIYSAISSDYCPCATDFEPPINSDYKYIIGFVNEKPIGVMIYHKYLDGNECHVQVLPEYRKEHAVKFGEQSLFFRGNLPLYAEIPELYKNVLNFALSNSFYIIDTIDDGYIKSGVKYPVNILKYRG